MCIKHQLGWLLIFHLATFILRLSLTEYREKKNYSQNHPKRMPRMYNSTARLLVPKCIDIPSIVTVDKTEPKKKKLLNCEIFLICLANKNPSQ